MTPRARSGKARRPAVRRTYELLRRRFGPDAWWPGDSPLEIALGAILTQNTAWRNAERALAALRARGLLRLDALMAAPPDSLQALLRPSGTYRVKARRVRALLGFVDRELSGRVEALGDLPLAEARERLLRVEGIGPETADAILLYAAGHPTFVVDAYTRRILERLGWLEGGEPYETVQRVFMDALPADAALFNDYHAQLVRLGKEHCRPRPRCDACPLEATCPRQGVAAGR